VSLGWVRWRFSLAQRVICWCALARHLAEPAARNSRLTEQLIALWDLDIILAGHVPLRRLCVSFTVSGKCAMRGEAIIAFFYYGAGLMFWPIFQLFHRRWSPCAKNLRTVFLVTLGVLIAYGALLMATWRGHQWLPLLLLFPVLNLLSLLVSAAVCVSSPKNYDR